MKKIYLQKEDIEKIAEIVKENNLTSFVLDYDDSSGIGIAIDLSFDTTYNGRDAKVTMSISGVEKW